MTQPPKPQTVKDAAYEWLESPEGRQCLLTSKTIAPQMALVHAFAVGVEWLTDELNEAMRNRGTLK